MRVFLAITEDQLGRLASSGRLDERLDGYVATPALRAALGLADEELEYALSTTAGELAAASLAAGGSVRGRRVVAIVELPGDAVEVVDDDLGEVVVEAITLARTEAVLADPEPVDLADPPDDLAWFATQELDQLR